MYFTSIDTIDKSWPDNEHGRLEYFHRLHSLKYPRQAFEQLGSEIIQQLNEQFSIIDSVIENHSDLLFIFVFVSFFYNKIRNKFSKSIYSLFCLLEVMTAVRVQIALKYFFDDNSSKQFHNFWYAFEPLKLLTVKDILEDIRLNYLKDLEENDERAFVIQLDDCQLLPFTSSQVLRDNDRLTLMPLTKYKIHKNSLENSVNFNLSSSMVIDPPVIISENNHKRQHIELESTITMKKSTDNVEEQPRKKKTKIKVIEDQDQVIVPPVTQSIPELPVTQSTSQVLKEPIIETDISSEAPLSLPSTNGRIHELRSKTPTWKAQPPPQRGNTEDKIHLRFDSESDEEPSSQTQTVIEEKKAAEPLPLVNGSNSSVRIHYVPTPVPTDVVKNSNETKTPKKTIDLLFEMKQHKTIEEKQAKKIQQQFGKKRAQHRKRALDYFSMANFVDQAFGVEKSELEKQISENGYHTSSSSPQTLPTSFNKLARLPLVAEAIENSDKMYDLYPPIIQCPSIQTRIAFKVLELSEDFCPKMSEFKEGTVIDVDQTTGELSIQLDKPLPTVFNQPSKFYAPLDELTEQDLTTMILPFSDLNSVRLLSTSNANNTT